MSTTAKSTDQLEEGNVVHRHGMRLKLTEHKVYPEGRFNHYGDVHQFEGVILNLADLLADDDYDTVPKAWLREGRWTVQGNSRALWDVETGKDPNLDPESRT